VEEYPEDRNDCKTYFGNRPSRSDKFVVMFPCAEKVFEKIRLCDKNVNAEKCHMKRNGKWEKEQGKKLRRAL